jgi:hypothetical protein
MNADISEVLENLLHMGLLSPKGYERIWNVNKGVVMRDSETVLVIGTAGDPSRMTLACLLATEARNLSEDEKIALRVKLSRREVYFCNVAPYWAVVGA